MTAPLKELTSIEERLGKLEGRSRALAKQNQRLKIVGGAALLLIGALVLGGGRDAKEHGSQHFGLQVQIS